MAKKRAVTSNDVASQAGVSRAAVSVVLNGARSNVRVSESTRKRIQAVAAELDYAPNRTAQALRRQQSGVIGFVPMPSRTWQTPYDNPVQYLLGIYIARSAIHHGFHVVEASAETTASRSSNELTRFLLNLRVDGVIFHGPGSVDEVQGVVDQGLPVVQLMRPQLAVPTPMITVDPEPGVAAAIDHLVKLGQERIAFLGTRSPHPNDAIRLECFRAALRNHGIDLPASFMQIEENYSIEDGRRGTHALLDLVERPTAIVAAGDGLALGALHALHELRVRVPDELSLISYDDTFAESVYPPLTSISQPFEHVAERTMSLLAERVLGSPETVNAPIHEVMPSRLVIRASSGPPKARR